MTDASIPGSRRGRPRRSRQATDDRRGQILAAARQLFGAEGYDGVSMRKIAARAGCSAAALYTLFPSKRHLLFHLWEGIFAGLGDALEQVDPTLPPVARLTRLCRVMVAFWLERPDDYRAIFLVEDRLEDTQDRYFVDSSEMLPRLAVLRRCIAEAQAAGALRAGEPEHLQNVLLCGVQGLVFNLITIPEFRWGAPDTLVDDTLGALITGLRPPPAR